MLSLTLGDHHAQVTVTLPREHPLHLYFPPYSFYFH